MLLLSETIMNQDNASAQTDIEQDVSQDDICALRKGHIP